MRTSFSKYGVRIPVDNGKPIDIPKTSAGLRISTDVTRDDNKNPIRFAYINDSLRATAFPGAPRIDTERLVWLALKPISEEIKRSKGVDAPPCLITESVEGTWGRIVRFTNLKDYWGEETAKRISLPPALSEEDRDILAGFLKRVSQNIEATASHAYKFETAGECVSPLLNFMAVHGLDYRPLQLAFSSAKDAYNMERDYRVRESGSGVAKLDEEFEKALCKACEDVAEYADVKDGVPWLAESNWKMAEEER